MHIRNLKLRSNRNRTLHTYWLYPLASRLSRQKNYVLLHDLVDFYTKIHTNQFSGLTVKMKLTDNIRIYNIRRDFATINLVPFM